MYPPRRSKSKNVPTAVKYTGHRDPGFRILCSTKKNQGSLEKFLIPGLGYIK